MLQSRRGFLIGAGAVLTTAFVAKAQSFVRETQTPLLTPNGPRSNGMSSMALR